MEFSILAHPGSRRAAADETPSRDPEKNTSRSKPARILVVEDERINAMVIVAMLENLGHTVTHAQNGREALEMLRCACFDCILMDIQMPELDGLETARLIRTSGLPGLDNTPIIAVTAHAMKGDRETFLAAGMNDYLTKPVEASALTSALCRALAGGTD